MLKCALRVKLCFTNCEIIPRWAKRSFAQAEIFRTNLPNSGAAVGGAATRNQPCCIKNVKWFCTTLVEGLGTNQGARSPALNRASKGPKKSGILNVSFLTTRKQGRKPDDVVSNAGIRSAGRLGPAAMGPAGPAEVPHVQSSCFTPLIRGSVRALQDPI